MDGQRIEGAHVVLRPATGADVPALAAIRRTPEVYLRWRGGTDLEAAVAEDLAESGQSLVVLYQDAVVGYVRWDEETDPDYRHASIDLYLDPAVHGRGLGTDTVRTLARHLIEAHGHHRLVIDPAADNAVAIHCYTKVGFRPVGVMRRYERGADGQWHDALLMDLLAAELTPDEGAGRAPAR
jgi:aminoglycoside 6'-N-acetyltransferase